jgi:hypothetical protein
MGEHANMKTPNKRAKRRVYVQDRDRKDKIGANEEKPIHKGIAQQRRITEKQRMPT